MRVRILTAVLIGAAGAAVAQDDTQIAAFVAAVEAAGCVIANDAQAAQVEAATGFDEATLGTIVSALLDRGDLVVAQSGDGIRLISAGCPR